MLVRWTFAAVNFGAQEGLADLRGRNDSEGAECMREGSALRSSYEQ
jgi:hypothetical protein